MHDIISSTETREFSGSNETPDRPTIYYAFFREKKRVVYLKLNIRHDGRVQRYALSVLEDRHPYLQLKSGGETGLEIHFTDAKNRSVSMSAKNVASVVCKALVEQGFNSSSRPVNINYMGYNLNVSSRCARS
jgi:hypothetical protein